MTLDEDVCYQKFELVYLVFQTIFGHKMFSLVRLHGINATPAGYIWNQLISIDLCDLLNMDTWTFISSMSRAFSPKVGIEPVTLHSEPSF